MKKQILYQEQSLFHSFQTAKPLYLSRDIYIHVYLKSACHDEQNGSHRDLFYAQGLLSYGKYLKFAK